MNIFKYDEDEQEYFVDICYDSSFDRGVFTDMDRRTQLSDYSYVMKSADRGKSDSINLFALKYFKDVKNNKNYRIKLIR